MIIDGVLQFRSPHVAPKPSTHQHSPRTPSYDKETTQTLAHDGLPPLFPKNYRALVVFANVSHFWFRNPSEGTIMDLFAEQHTLGGETQGIVVVNKGNVVCSGKTTECAAHLSSPIATVVDLRGGAIQPGLVSYGADLGLLEIAMEPSTTDGYVADPLDGQPAIFGSGGYVAKAVDGLQFGTRDALYVKYRSHLTHPLLIGFLLQARVPFWGDRRGDFPLARVVAEWPEHCVYAGRTAQALAWSDSARYRSGPLFPKSWG